MQTLGGSQEFGNKMKYNLGKINSILVFGKRERGREKERKREGEDKDPSRRCVLFSNSLFSFFHC